MFERLREALDNFLDAATPVDPRDVTRKMHAAVVETRAAIHGLHDDLAESEQKLRDERQKLDDAERRGKMASDIGDQETADIAETYATKHRERVDVLERKLIAQRHEIELAERELGEMKIQLKKARDHRGIPNDLVDEALGNLESAQRGASEDDLLRVKFDQATREAAAENKLAELKKKMGR